MEWPFFAFVFFGIIAYIAWIRWQDRKWINERFDSRSIKAMSFGVNYFGLASEAGKPKRSSGFLLLLQDRLLYRSRFKKIELEIPGKRIHHVAHDRGHKGVDLHQSVVKVFFLNEQGEQDCAAFRLPYPPQWMRAMANAFDLNLNTGGQG